MSTSRLGSRRRSDPGKRWARVSMAVLATIGVIDTGAITLTRWGWIGSLSCPGGSEGGCDRVLNSAWGSVLGQPLSLLGLLAYGAVLVLALLPLVLPAESRRRASELSWMALLLISAGMAVFSLLLMGLLVFKIQAFCFFCVLSALLSIALLVLTLLGGGWSEPGPVVFRALITAIAVGLVGAAWASAVDPARSPQLSRPPNSPPPVTSTSTPASIALADHLQEQGAVMYSAYWCPHCHDQKELFGTEATSRLTIIECAEDGLNSQRELCESKGLLGFPSWEINGTLDSGVKSLETLSDLSGYEGSREFR
ncbi:thioredoxin [Synechococcus sp. RSCCF101]|uniref:vitamin K epoxide reductase family protein n=1 Tax=Synechococcus sp. RSCCF101 TaxID=2511069 RepID=UPI0012484A3B|nr:vitamin K epoxide reductase family protein [Synechococcus sp. RSCCF101]QEY32930.1 thioredoxin [Synechococcus sp. RSCCF101]